MRARYNHRAAIYLLLTQRKKTRRTTQQSSFGAVCAKITGILTKKITVFGTHVDSNHRTQGHQIFAK
jgi:hypothetical protein